MSLCNLNSSSAHCSICDRPSEGPASGTTASGQHSTCEACNKCGLVSRFHPYLQRLQSSLHPAQYQAHATLTVCAPPGLFLAGASAWPDAPLHSALQPFTVQATTQPQHAGHCKTAGSRSTRHLICSAASSDAARPCFGLCLHAGHTGAGGAAHHAGLLCAGPAGASRP